MEARRYRRRLQQYDGSILFWFVVCTLIAVLLVATK